MASRSATIDRGRVVNEDAGAATRRRAGCPPALAADQRGAVLVELDHADGSVRRGVEAQLAEHALVEVVLDDLDAASFRREDVDRADLLELARQLGVVARRRPSISTSMNRPGIRRPPRSPASA